MNKPKVDQLRLALYMKYLQLYEYGTALDVFLFDKKLYHTLPKEFAKIRVQEKQAALKFLEKKKLNRFAVQQEITRLELLAACEGYKVMPDKVDQYLHYARQDTLMAQS